MDALRGRLSADNQRLLDEFTAFVVTRQQAEDDRAAEEENKKYEKLARYYDGLFVEDSLKDGVETDLAFASGREYRDRLEQFIADKAKGKHEERAVDILEDFVTSKGESASMVEGKAASQEFLEAQQAKDEESISRIMEAYDRLHPEAADEEGRYAYGIVRFPE